MLYFITKSKLFRPLHPAIVLLGIAALFTACASQNAANINTADTAGETKLITDIITSEDAESTIVTVKGNQTLTYTAIKQVFPLGVIFHFPETTLDNIKNAYYPPENDTISSIRATQIEEDEMTSRIFIALKKDLPYNITPDDAGLHISFPKTGQQIIVTELESTQTEKAEKQPAPELAKTTARTATRITSVTATPLKRNVVVNVKADGKINNYQSFTVDNPPRIVFDLFNLRSPYKGENQIAVESKWVGKVRHFGYPDKIRLVLDTKKAYLSKFSSVPVNKGLLIYVGTIPATTANQESKPVLTQAPSSPEPDEGKTPKDQATAPAVAETKLVEAKEKVVQPAAAETKPVEVKEKVVQPAAAEIKSVEVKAKTVPVKYDKPAWLNRIDFSSEEAGRSALIIGTTRPVEYKISKVNDKRLQLRLLNTNLPEYRKRALITTRFQSAVDRITPTQQPKTKDTVIAIELREAVPYIVKQTDNVVRVNFSPSSIPPKPYEDAKLPAWKRVLADPGTELSGGSEKNKVSSIAREELKPAKEDISLADRLAGVTAAEKYTGEQNALDFYDTDIKNVFRIIREISGKNFAIDKNVTGKVTLALEKPVPWDQVLDLVLKMNQLGLTMEGDIIRIATLNTLAQEEKLRQAKLKAAQTALNQQKALEPLLTEYIPINYSNAKTEILPHIKPILTANRGKVSVDTRNNQIIITDTIAKIQKARQIVEIIDKVTPQVIIEARIVEANTSFTRELGFDWGEVIAGPFDIGDATLTLTGLASNLPPTTTVGQIGGTFSKMTGTPFQIIDAKLVASETQGKTNIISAPKVVTLDNKKAKIKQGLEVPYLERDSSGNATVRFKNVDLLLEVTPNITPDDRIVMKIFVTKNDVVDPTADQPALSTNEAETELLVDDGDTIVIGGIVKSTIQYSENGIPGLRKLGVLGWLFKSQVKKDSKNELLIFITPRIVKLEQKKMKI